MILSTLSHDTTLFSSDSKMSWFHGKICREEAERRLKYQGDYLVRSHGNGQFVLSCMDSGHVRHLLLVDPHGQVNKTRDVNVSRDLHVSRDLLK